METRSGIYIYVKNSWVARIGIPPLGRDISPFFHNKIIVWEARAELEKIIWYTFMIYGWTLMGTLLRKLRKYVSKNIRCHILVVG
jgi:hypothetical protein